MRIISLVPSHTEILFALGLGRRVVGVTNHCDYPPEVEKIHRVGSFANPGAEKIISLCPDLVLIDSRLQGGCMKELKRAGIRTYDFFPLNPDDLFSGMDEISYIAGAGADARQLIEDMRSKAGELADKAKSFPSRRLLFIMEGNALVTPGPASFQHGVFSSLGCELYQGAYNISYIPITWEDALRFDPEIILFCGRFPGDEERKRCPGCHIENRPCARDIESVYNNSALSGVSAFRKQQIFTVPCRFFCRPGPRMLDGMEWLAGLKF